MVHQNIATARNDTVRVLDTEQLLYEIMTFLISWGVPSVFGPKHESVKDARVVYAPIAIRYESKGMIQTSEYRGKIHEALESCGIIMTSCWSLEEDDHVIISAC